MITGDAGRLIGGRYRFDRELGSGTHTQTLLVTDSRNGRPCVLRRLSLATAPAAAVRRFKAQAAIIAKLDHPSLPRFIDGFVEGEGDASARVVVTSFFPGESLERLVAKDRPLVEAQAIALIGRIVRVLAYLHAFVPPLVHRSIKASGIIVGPDGRPYLTDLDYEVAEPAGTTSERALPAPAELGIAAPEVFSSGAVPASDIYALGLAVIRGMAAENPAVLLREGSRMQLRAALGAGEAFTSVIARMVEPALERRYPDLQALEADLARVAGGRVIPPQQPARAAEEPRPSRSARPLVLAVVCLALVLLAALALRLRQQPAPEESLLLRPAQPEQPLARPPSVEEKAPTEPAAAPETAREPATAAPAETLPPAPESSPPAASVPAPDALAQGEAVPESAPVPEPVAPVAPVVAEGRLLFDGKPFADAAAPGPLFWFRNEGTKAIEKPEVEYAAGAFVIRGLRPGRYGMSVRIDLDLANPNIFPGDLNAWAEFAVGAGGPVRLELPLRRVLHLLQPVDNSVVIRGWEVPCGAGNPTRSPVVFAWEPLAIAASYNVSVDRIDCRRGAASAERIFTSSSTEAWVKVELSPSRAGECYSFRLTARRENQPVGILAIHGKADLGWDYRFTVTE